ncbi:MAG: hypothetical protein AAF772_03185 [Acidobacteriota bacterium]
MASSPEYLICLSCETPCYTFEWADGKLTEVICEVCGEDNLDAFASEEDFEAMISDPSHGGGGH